MPEEKAGDQAPEPDVVDRRKSKQAAAQAEESEATTGETPPEEPGEDLSLPPEVLEVLVPSSVDSVLHAAVGHLARLAWEHLGLVQSARTGEIRADYAEAGRAVDAVDAIAKLLLPQVTGHDRRDLESLVADLKINFVKHTRERAEE